MESRSEILARGLDWGGEEEMRHFYSGKRISTKVVSSTGSAYHQGNAYPEIYAHCDHCGARRDSSGKLYACRLYAWRLYACRPICHLYHISCSSSRFCSYRFSSETCLEAHHKPMEGYHCRTVNAGHQFE